ncbi:hypothetical protein [Sphingobacterium multivorum]|uniref:hypothetical protein n=1 Tax=Sphingobacterium multivorum TaxID=28454 RepID=UPI00289F2005|nr:hypothetical protein [Sphingobacterium multivorum]
MRDINKFTKAALILVEAQKMVENLIGAPIELQFEIKHDNEETTDEYGTKENKV